MTQTPRKFMLPLLIQRIGLKSTIERDWKSSFWPHCSLFKILARPNAIRIPPLRCLHLVSHRTDLRRPHQSLVVITYHQVIYHLALPPSLPRRQVWMGSLKCKRWKENITRSLLAMKVMFTTMGNIAIICFRCVLWIGFVATSFI